MDDLPDGTMVPSCKTLSQTSQAAPKYYPKWITTKKWRGSLNSFSKLPGCTMRAKPNLTN